MSASDRTVFTTDLDWSTDDVSEEEWKSLSEWYISSHGKGDLDLVRFLPFMLDNRPDALKHYRRWVEVVNGGYGLDGTTLPGAALAMMALHFYMNLGYSDGIMYEIISCRVWGATKPQVQEVLALAWLHAGPFGVNVTAKVAEEYMSDWNEDDVAQGGIDWPDGWAPDPQSFQAGLDYTTSTLSEDEKEGIKRWYLDWQGEVPEYVQFFAEHHPLALKLQRRRYETAIRGSLPKEMIPIMELNLSLLKERPNAARRAALHAKTLGVTKSQILQVAAHSGVYLGDAGMDVVPKALGELIEKWSAGT